MYNKPRVQRTTINVNQSTEGETIETKVQRIVNNKEPIKDGAPIIYTERKQGVLAGTNIRTDRFEVAVEAMDKVTASKIAKRESKLKAVKDDQSDKTTDPKTGTAGAEPIQGTNN